MSKKFDDIISKKLANLNPKPTPNSWELFEGKLDAAMSAGEGPSLTDHSFDELIANKLSHLKTEDNPQAWSLFEQKLDQLPSDQTIPVTSFDQIIATQLRRQQPAYNHNHWLILKKRLDWISFITNRLALYKLSELTLLLVFLFYLGELATFNNNEPIHLNKTPVAEQSTETPEQLDNLPIATQDNRNFPSPLAQIESAPTKNELVSISSSAQAEAIKSISFPTLQMATIEANPTPFAELEQNRAFRNSQLISDLLPLDGVGFKVLPESEKAVSERFALGLKENDIPQTLEDFRMEDIESLAANPLVPERIISLAELIKPVNKKPIINFSMMGAFDYNRIITPENKEFRLTSFDRYEIGYGGGFLFGIEKGRFGLQTGGLYSYKHVRPIRVAYLEGNFDQGYLGEVLKEYDYSTISIPVNITYDVIRQNGWRIYAIAGASLNVVYEANYYVVLNRGKNVGGYGFAGSGLGSASTATTRTQLDEVKFPRGWFQGGSFTENSYITTNIGVGVERFLQDRWSVFAQPTYQHGLIFMNQGLGPFKDQLRTMSFFTGIRVRLIR